MELDKVRPATSEILTIAAAIATTIATAVAIIGLLTISSTVITTAVTTAVATTAVATAALVAIAGLLVVSTAALEATTFRTGGTVKGLVDADDPSVESIKQ